MKKTLFWTFLLSVFWGIILFFLKTYWMTEKGFNLALIPLILVYMWIPGAIAIVFSKKEKIHLPIFKKSNRYLQYACLVPIVLSLLSFAFSFLFAKFHPIDLSDPNLSKFVFFASPLLNYLTISLIILISGVVIGGTINILSTLGEELMWRGYLYEKCKNLGFWKSSFFIGSIWGLWHLPLYLLSLGFQQKKKIKQLGGWLLQYLIFY